jgi:DNA/RNA endonuclease YhcR with UshA esterase domain
MKTWLAVILISVIAAVFAPAAARAASQPAAGVPKYDRATEAVFKGTVEEVKDRECPVSGGMGSHLILKLDDGTTIEVHLAPTKFVKTYELVFNKGDQVEVTGSKVKFEGVDTIFAREVKRGNDDFVFRDQDGKPVW